MFCQVNVALSETHTASSVVTNRSELERIDGKTFFNFLIFW